MLDVVTYKYNPERDNIPVNSAIATATKLMHDMGGLAYADEVQFIASAAGESTKTVMVCNCVRMQELLQKNNTETSDVMETFRAISHFETQPEDANEHYFEVPKQKRKIPLFGL